MNPPQVQNLSWVSWNKLTTLIPIKRTSFNSALKPKEKSRFDINIKYVGLPKLGVKRILGNNSVPRSPRPKGAFTKFTKTFSPVLTRGRTSQMSKMHSQ